MEARLALARPRQAPRRLAPVEAIAAVAVARTQARAIQVAVPCQVLVMAAKPGKASPLVGVPVPSTPRAAPSAVPVPSLAMSVGPTRLAHEVTRGLVPVIPVRVATVAVAPPPPIAVPRALGVPMAVTPPTVLAGPA